MKVQFCTVVLVAALFAGAQGQSTPPVGPVIGILTQNCEDDCPPVSPVTLYLMNHFYPSPQKSTVISQRATLRHLRRRRFPPLPVHWCHFLHDLTYSTHGHGTHKTHPGQNNIHCRFVRQIPREWRSTGRPSTLQRAAGQPD